HLSPPFPSTTLFRSTRSADPSSGTDPGPSRLSQALRRIEPGSRSDSPGQQPEGNAELSRSAADHRNPARVSGHAGCARVGELSRSEEHTSELQSREN